MRLRAREREQLVRIVKRPSVGSWAIGEKPSRGRRRRRLKVRDIWKSSQGS